MLLTPKQRQDTPLHFLGVGIFTGGSAFSWILMLYLSQRKGARAYDYAVYACVLTTFALAASFLLMYGDGDLPGCWLVEQLALLANILSFIIFFTQHSFDPRLSLADHQEAAKPTRVVPVYYKPMPV